jgi:ligand-binding SRPBCC domain-containing protein
MGQFLAEEEVECLEVHLAGNVHSGEAMSTGGVTSGLIGVGHRGTWRARHFAVWHNLTSEITAMDPPSYFQDTMVHGPFRFMQHDHFFRPLSSEQTEMKDVFRFAAPLPILGRLAEVPASAATCRPCSASETR